MAVNVQPVVQALQDGQLACFPTETLWALSCAAFDTDAVAEVFAAKGRQSDVPLALGCHSWRAAQTYIVSTPGADALARKFLPGPLTIIVKMRDDRLEDLAPGRGTIGIRVPDHEAALRILDAAGPLVMTSANKHGAPDALSADEVRAAFPGILVLDGDDVPGTGSTVVDATGDRPRVLREGVISAKEVDEAWL